MKREDHEGPVHMAVLQRLAFELPKAIIHHSPNEGGSAGRARGKRAKSLGTVPGWPDIEVLIEGGVTLFFEVKAPATAERRAGRESKDQKSLRLKGEALGHRWAVVWGQEDVIAALDTWGVKRRSVARS